MFLVSCRNIICIRILSIFLLPSHVWNIRWIVSLGLGTATGGSSINARCLLFKHRQWFQIGVAGIISYLSSWIFLIGFHFLNCKASFPSFISHSSLKDYRIYPIILVFINIMSGLFSLKLHVLLDWSFSSCDPRISLASHFSFKITKIACLILITPEIDVRSLLNNTSSVLFTCLILVAPIFYRARLHLCI